MLPQLFFEAPPTRSCCC